MRGWIVSFVVSLTIAGCGGDDGLAANEALTDSEYPVCEEFGVVVLDYLRTGDAHGYPELEQTYAQRRAEILNEPSDVRDELARATASDYVDWCDEQHAAADEQRARDDAEAEAERQRRAAEAEAEREREAAEAEAVRREGERVARFDSECRERGGNVNDTHDYCWVEDPSHGELRVPISRDGTFNEGDAAAARTDCEAASQDAQNAAADGRPWTELPRYDERAGVCYRGGP